MAHGFVLVTGANGFIARHLIVTLLNKGYRVRGTLRNLKVADSLRAILATHAPVEGLSFATADLLKDAGWADAVAGVDAIFHMASPFPATAVFNRQRLIKPAVQGSLRVLKAAHVAGVHRVVVTSSLVAIAYGRGSTTMDRPFSETDWTNLKAPGLGAYHESKTRAELAVWDFAMKHPDMEITAINPGAVFGPLIGDDVGTSAGLIAGLMRGDFPGLPRIGFEGVDVRDVAEMHERVLNNEETIGKRYVCAAGFVWLRDIARMLREDFAGHAKKVPSRDLPDMAVRLVALVDRKASLAVPELGLYWPCSRARATADLGWQPRSSTEAVRATAQSLIEAGIVT